MRRILEIINKESFATLFKETTFKPEDKHLSEDKPPTKEETAALQHHHSTDAIIVRDFLKNSRS